jgi:hypothetical protein
MTINIKCEVCDGKDAMVYYFKIPCCVKCYNKKRGSEHEPQRGIQTKN